MEQEEIYRSPQAELVGTPATGAEAITPLMLDHLRRTRPWITLIAVTGTVLTGLAGLLGALGAIGLALGATQDAGAPGLAILLLYVSLVAVYALPTWLLWRCSAALRAVGQGAGAGAVETALDRQRAFWRAIGILTLVVIGLYGVAAAVAVVMAIFASV